MRALPDGVFDSDVVTVCSACLRASCWHGQFMCDGSKTAGTVRKTVAELRPLRLEHPDYWKLAAILDPVCDDEPEDA